MQYTDKNILNLNETSLSKMNITTKGAKAVCISLKNEREMENQINVGSEKIFYQKPVEWAI